MFGRVRASSVGSLELLEMERPPPKIIKHDSLSIYESTLLKLKQGSQCNRRPNSEDSTTVDACGVMAIDSPEASMTAESICSLTDSLPNSSSSVQSAGRNMSILHFFSKCKSSQHANASDEAVMAIEHAHSSSSCDVSPASSS